jgi:hypothetical protein
MIAGAILNFKIAIINCKLLFYDVILGSGLILLKKPSAIAPEL